MTTEEKLDEIRETRRKYYIEEISKYSLEDMSYAKLKYIFEIIDDDEI